jgi:hypothetical protein
MPFEPVGSSFAIATPPAPAPGAGPRPSAAGYWIGGVVGVVGVIAAMAWLVSGIIGYFGAVDGYPRFSVPGSRTVQLDAGTYQLFAEYPRANVDLSGINPVGTVRVVDDAEHQMVISSATVTETYSWNGHDGRAIGKFRVPTAGAYTITAAAPTRGSSTLVQVAVGHGLGESVVGSMLGALALGAVAVLTTIGLIIITAVRQSRWRRRSLPPTGPGYQRYPGGYGPPGAYPPPAGFPPPSVYPLPGGYPSGPPPMPPPGAPWGAPPGGQPVVPAAPPTDGRGQAPPWAPVLGVGPMAPPEAAWPPPFSPQPSSPLPAPATSIAPGPIHPPGWHDAPGVARPPDPPAPEAGAEAP